MKWKRNIDIKLDEHIDKILMIILSLLQLLSFCPYNHEQTCDAPSPPDRIGPTTQEAKLSVNWKHESKFAESLVAVLGRY